MSHKPTTKISADIGSDLIQKLDMYCKNVKKNRSEVIRILLNDYFDDEAHNENTSKQLTLLADPLFIKRIKRLLLIIIDHSVHESISKEAKELWQSLNQSSK